MRAAERIDHGASRPPDPMPGAIVEYGGYLSAICIASTETVLATQQKRFSNSKSDLVCDIDIWVGEAADFFFRQCQLFCI